MQSSIPTTGRQVDRPLVSRRSVVAAGAWSLPLVSLAVAAPSASASTTTSRFDLAVVGLQFGESFPLFTPDYSQSYTTYVPLSNFAVANLGDEPSPASGFVASYTVDNELARLDRVGYRATGESDPTYVDDVETIVTGTRTEYRWLVPLSIPVNTSSDPLFPSSIVALVVESTMLRRYPDDTYDVTKLEGAHVSATAVAGESRTDNNRIEALAYSDLAPATPYAAETEVTFETVELGAGPARTSRPRSVRITSIGPSPLPSTASALVSFDVRSTTNWSIGAVRLNGTPTSAYLQDVVDETRPAWSNDQVVSATLGAPLAAGDVLEFELVSDAPGAGEYFVPNTAGYAGFRPADINDRSQRTTEFAYKYGVAPA